MEACYKQDNYVLLDERAQINLARLLIKQSTMPQTLPFGGGVVEGKDSLIEATKYIIHYRDNTLRNIQACLHNSSTFNNVIRRIFPINIPDDELCKLNKDLVSCLNGSIEFNDCQSIFNISDNNIEKALNIAKIYNPDLDIKKVIEFLSQHHNLQQDIVPLMQYDATISASSFNEALHSAQSPLYYYNIINSKGHFTFPNRVTIFDSLNAAQIIEKKYNLPIGKTLLCMIQNYNLAIESHYSSTNSKELSKFIANAMHDIHPKLKDFCTEKELKKIHLATNTNKFEDIEDYVAKIGKYISDTSKLSKIKDMVNERVLQLMELEKLLKMYNKNDQYSDKLQKSFLDLFDQLGINKFDELTITKTIAFPDYRVNNDNAFCGSQKIIMRLDNHDIQICSNYLQNIHQYARETELVHSSTTKEQKVLIENDQLQTKCSTTTDSSCSQKIAQDTVSVKNEDIIPDQSGKDKMSTVTISIPPVKELCTTTSTGYVTMVVSVVIGGAVVVGGVLYAVAPRDRIVLGPDGQGLVGMLVTTGGGVFINKMYQYSQTCEQKQVCPTESHCNINNHDSACIPGEYVCDVIGQNVETDNLG